MSSLLQQKRSAPAAKQGEFADRSPSPELHPAVEIPGGKSARLSLLALLALAAGLFVYMVRDFFVPIVLAAVFTGFFHPFFKSVLKLTREHRGLAAFFSYILLSIGVLLPVFGIVQLVGREAVRVYQERETKGMIQASTDYESLLKRFPALIKLGLEKLPVPETAEAVLRKAAETLSGVVNRASRKTFELGAHFFLTFFTMFYFFRDGPVLLKRLKYFSPLTARQEEELVQRFLSVSRATLKGTVLVAVIKGVLGGLTFWAFGIQAPLLWGVVMVLLSVLPVVGAWLVMYPAAAYLFISGHFWAGLGYF